MNYLQSESKANVQLDDDAFWNVDHVTLAYYPVGPEDYEGTTVCPLEPRTERIRSPSNVDMY